MAFLNEWSTENFGKDHFNRGIDALSSGTCIDLLTKIPREKSKQIRENTVENSDSDSKIKNKKYWKNFHSEENNNPKERQLNLDNYLLLQIQNEISLFRGFLVTERFW